MILSSSLLFNARLVLWSGYSVKVKFTRKRLSHTEVQKNDSLQRKHLRNSVPLSSGFLCIGDSQLEERERT